MAYNHFFDTVTNTSGDSLIGYFARVLDAGGSTVPIYSDANGTPVSVVSGVTNMAKTDALGNLSLYVDPGTYSLDIYAPDATTFRFRVPNVAMNSTKGDKGDQGDKGDVGTSDNTYSTLATLKASDIARKAARLVGASGITDGLFNWTLGNFTGQADDQNIIKADSTALSVGAWVRQGAGAILFKQALTGAQPLDLQRKAAETVSINDFYSEGDSDHTLALQKAIDSGAGAIFIPRGEYIIGTVTGANVYIYGLGTLRKKAGTKGFLIDLTGDNRIEGVTFDYDYPNNDPSAPHFDNVAVDQVGGSLTLNSVKFKRTDLAAVYVLGGSLYTDQGCQFIQGKPHNGLSGGNERVTHYIVCTADADTDDQVVSINGGYFEGASLDPALLHLNPTGILITANGLDGARYRTVNINNAILLGCSTNAGNGNITGAIDTYNGAENVTISGCTIRYYTYAAIKIQNSSNFVITGNTCNSGYVPAGAHTPQSLSIATIEKARGSTVEQRNGIIANNILSNLKYTAISNSCDYVVIRNNEIAVVEKVVLGTAIYNTGNHVSISGNMASAVEGIHIFSSGDYVEIEANDTESGVGAGPSASDNAVFATGVGLKVRNNRFRSTSASPGPCIRTNGPLSAFDIAGNDINGFTIGVDLRTSEGAVDNGTVGAQRFTAIALPFNIAAGCTNIGGDYLLQQPATVSTLPTSVPAGMKGYVTDANAPAFGATVAGGGSAFTPVYRDAASNWKVG